MREIKFRVWVEALNSNKPNKMHYNWRIQDEHLNDAQDQMPIETDGDFSFGIFDGLSLNDYLNGKACNPNFKYTFLQYTGCKDKNGKEIWEGDIVTGCYYENTVAVEWIDEDAGWFPFTQPSYGGYEWEADSPDRVEVIGNIYENPELMEK